MGCDVHLRQQVPGDRSLEDGVPAHAWSMAAVESTIIQGMPHMGRRHFVRCCKSGIAGACAP